MAVKSGVFIVNFEHILTPFSSVYVVDFESVIVCRVSLLHRAIVIGPYQRSLLNP